MKPQLQDNFGMEQNNLGGSVSLSHQDATNDQQEELIHLPDRITVANNDALDLNWDYWQDLLEGRQYSIFNEGGQLQFSHFQV